MDNKLILQLYNDYAQIMRILINKILKYKKIWNQLFLKSNAVSNYFKFIISYLKFVQIVFEFISIITKLQF